MRRLVFFLLFLPFLVLGSENGTSLSVCSSTHDSPLSSFFTTTFDSNDCRVSWATVYYENAINITGWAFVDVKMWIGGQDPFKTGYVAGFAEGNATRELIKLYKRNMIDPFCEDAEEFCAQLNEFLKENYDWVMGQIKNNREDSYWNKIAMVLGQVKGMIDGFEGFFDLPMTTKQIITHPVYYMQLFGDLEDLKEKFHYPEEKDVPRKSKSHCSALVKVLPSQSEILFSHVTWTSYASMLRMNKKYSFPVGEAGRVISFSGYPGVVTSIDDFALTSAKLAILETTIENHNESLWKLVTPKSVLYFLRAPAAHYSAGSGKEWAATFSKYNSGTYNNQWQILDYNKFRRGRPTQKSGLLTMLEQMPGMIVVTDLTDQLMEKTYWSGYNRVYSPQLFAYSGQPTMVKKFGNWYSYDKAPRALIFARDQGNVKDIYSMLALMRYNNFQEDPLSRCDCTPPYSAESTIAARSDLNSPNGKYPIKDLGFMDMGATDAKITSSQWIESLQFLAVIGPPGNDKSARVPEFNWETSILKDTVPHYGQPSLFRFNPCLYNWDTRTCDYRY